MYSRRFLLTRRRGQHRYSGCWLRNVAWIAFRHRTSAIAMAHGGDGFDDVRLRAHQLRHPCAESA